MKIAVLGAGGIGGYIGGRLAEVGHDVCLVARGRHLKAISEKGLKIESPLGDAHLKHIKAVEQIADVGTVDNVIEHYSKQPAAQSSSLIVDILAGRPTELKWLSGRVHTLGLETGTPTPAHSLVWNALFDYKDSRSEYAL